MTAASIDPRAKQLILQVIQDESLRPTELVQNLLEKQLTPSAIQDALAVLLDTGVIEMGPDRRLHLAEVAA